MAAVSSSLNVYNFTPHEISPVTGTAAETQRLRVCKGQGRFSGLTTAMDHEG